MIRRWKILLVWEFPKNWFYVTPLCYRNEMCNQSITDDYFYRKKTRIKYKNCYRDDNWTFTISCSQKWVCDWNYKAWTYLVVQKSVCILMNVSWSEYEESQCVVIDEKIVVCVCVSPAVSCSLSWQTESFNNDRRRTEQSFMLPFPLIKSSTSWIAYHALHTWLVVETKQVDT